MSEEANPAILLSILLPTVPWRLESHATPLIKHLLGQIGDRGDVELLALFGTRNRPHYQKFNDLLSLASGKYLAFVHDDDWVSDDWLSSITTAAESDPDIILFHLRVEYPAGHHEICEPDLTGICHEADIGEGRYRSHPHPFNVWRSSLAKTVEFDHTQAEDINWSMGLAKRVVRSVSIPRPLYFYRLGAAR
jgi:glycosyltransferase involved in cell wall biosynthesis